MKRIAAIQMASGPNVSANLTEAGRLISRAVDAGAELVALPENFALMSMKEADKVSAREALGRGPMQDFLAEQADKHRVWLIGGTIPLEAESPQRIRAACLAYDDKGKMVARYDKIHLFDVRLRGGEETYTESDTIEAGRQTTVFDSPFGRIGLAVCYDLRFPELFRRLADQGVDIIAVPSAFTAITGKAHWEVLVRARAIENLAYVLAPDQGGFHLNGRETYGHSMIVDPWGAIVDRLPSGSGYVIAEVDTNRIMNTREHFPALLHRRSTEDLAV